MSYILIYIACQIIVCCLLNCNSYKYYRPVYKMLPFKRFYRSKEYVYSHALYEDDDGFVWILKNNSFAVAKGKLLTKAYYTWCDPFSAYWLRKFHAWFKENVNSDNLPEFTKSSSYPSTIKAEKEFSSVYSYDGYLRRYYAAVALRTLVTKDAPTEDIVKDVVELSTKLVAELRFKEKMGN